MSSTNKTTNYDLSQFLGTDKPAWLTDYNTDMGKIDTGINNAQTTATGADGKATSNATAIGTLANLTTDVNTDLVSAINEVDAHADTAQGTANGAATTANAASTDIASLKNYLNLSSETALTWSANIGTVGTNTVKVRTNNTASLCKIYGYLTLTGSASNNNITIESNDSGLRPTTAITITGCGFVRSDRSTSPLIRPLDYTINTNGKITATLPNNATDQQSQGIFFEACLIFVENFGDLPTPE